MPNLASFFAIRPATPSIVDSNFGCLESTNSHFRRIACGASAGNWRGWGLMLVPGADEHAAISGRLWSDEHQHLAPEA
jgi:hypothetical protein